MRKLEEITKEEFDRVSNEFPPNKFVEFIYKYFSKGTEKKDIAYWNILMIALGSLFFMGFIFTILELPRVWILYPTMAYAIILPVLVLTVFTAIKINQRRLKKIYTKLDVSIEDYNKLVLMYYPPKQ